MVNLNCQNIIDDLQHIQNLKKKCDVVLINGSKGDNVKSLKELYSFCLEIYDQLIIDFNTGERDTKLYFQDFIDLKSFLDEMKETKEKITYIGVENNRITTIHFKNWIFNKLKLNNLFLRLRDLALVDCEIGNIEISGTFKNLNTLNLSRSGVNKDEFTFLRDLKSLGQLDVSESNFEDLEDIKDLPDLRFLNISGCIIKDFTKLLTMPSLQLVNYKLSMFSDIHLSSLKKASVMEKVFEELRNRGIRVST